MANAPANLLVLLGLGLAGILLMTKRLKKAVKPDFGAFVQRLQLLPPPPPPPPKAPHPLTGLTFAVSDVFDIEGSITGFGSLDWSNSHEAASRTSPIVSALVEGGASCIGKTVVDEMGLSISGENKHYGTPTNPTVSERIPGGSSSGAAVAVAARIADFALGLDTVGGVRIPAGYCGILGFRPSYGLVPQTGVLSVSSSLDTVGIFANDANVLRLVGHVLLQFPFAVQRNPRIFIVADDCFSSLSTSADRVTRAVMKTIEEKFGRQVLKHENFSDFLSSKVPTLRASQMEKSNGELKSSLWQLAQAMQRLMQSEFKQKHKDWINSVSPTLDPVISSQVGQASDITEAEIEDCHAVRSELRAALNLLLKDDGILVIPTTSDPPPKLGSKEVASKDYLMRTSTLTSIVSMSGCCQVAVPLGLYEKCPVSVSLIAKHGGDRFLLDTVQTMYGALQQQADLAANAKLSNDTVSQEESAEMAKEKGNQAFKEKQWQRAIGMYTEAIKLNGKSATYFGNRAAAYLEVGNFSRAEEDATRAIDLDKKNVKAYLRRGTAREMLGYYKEAVEDFRHALVLEPKNKRAAQSAERLRTLFQ